MTRSPLMRVHGVLAKGPPNEGVSVLLAKFLLWLLKRCLGVFTKMMV